MGKYNWKTSRAEELKKEKVNNVYYYSITPSSNERGYNRTINLFIIKKDYSLVEIANYCVNTASYKGDRAVAHNMISDIFNHNMKDGYTLLSNKIKVYSIN